MKMRSGFRTLFGVFSGLVALCIALAAPVARATDAIIASPTVGSGPTFLAITPDGQYVYTANEVDGSVSVIATATNTVIATVPVGSYPMSVAITPNGKYAYVTNYGDNTVSVIATATNTVVATVGVGSAPYFVAITPNGQYAYITNFDDNTVSVINTSTNTVISTVATTGDGPYALAITPNGKYVYVTNYNLYVSTAPSTVSVIDTATNTVIATVPVGYAPAFVAITPNGKYAYVSNYNSTGIHLPSDTVSVIDTATNTVIATIPVSPGTNPDDIAFTPDGKYAYVTGYNGTVSVIDTATSTLIATITGLNGNPSWVLITPDGQYAYIPSNTGNTVYVIATMENADAALRNTIVQIIPLPTGSIHPISETITPDGRCVYVGNGNGTGFTSPIPGTVTVIARNVTGAMSGSCAPLPQSGAAPIPTQNNLVLAMLALLLASMTFAGLRRRG